MRKKNTILLSLVIAFFTLLFGGITTLADEQMYDDIEDGEYKIAVEALEGNSDDTSAANGFLMDKATLSINGDDITITFDYTKDFTMDYGINWTKLEDDDPIDVGGDDKLQYFTFQINEIKEIYKASMNYYVPGMPGDMGDEEKGHSVDYRIVLDEDDLNGLPPKSDSDDEETEKEEPEPEPAPEERVVGTQIIESEADAVYQLNYETDSKATAAQLENPVKLLEKDDRQYIQIPINEGGANFFRSLEINGEQVIWNSITEGPYTIQFELPGNIEDTLTLDMVIQAGPNAMPHDGIEVWFNTDTIETIKEPETPETPEEPEEKPEENEENGSNGDKDVELTPEISEKVNYVVKHATEDETSAADSFFTKPGNLIERDGEKYIQLTIKSWSMIDWLRTDQGDVEIIKVNDDDSAVVEFEVTGDLSDAINLTMKVTVPGIYSEEHKARLFLEEGEGEDLVIDPVVPTPTPEPEPKPTPKPDPKPKEKSELVPDKAFKIDYVVKHATEDKTSAADSFFNKPAFLLYGENGEQYIQLTINSWDMIDWIRTEHGGDVTVVKENDDGSALIQFQVTGDLSDVINLNMHITVPGMYSMEHDARIFLDVDSKKEVDTSDYQIVVDKEGSVPGSTGSTGSTDLTDPTDPKGPGKPEFGNGDNVKNGEEVVKSGKTDNPQTGDTTSILLYTLLLIGSIIPLAVKLRRRFI